VLSTKPPRKEEKWWVRQLRREILTATSGQSVRRLTLIPVVTGSVLAYGVLMAWVLSNVRDWSAPTPLEMAYV